MKIRIKTFAQIKEILGADSFIDYPDGVSMKELLKTLRQKAGNLRISFFQEMETCMSI